MPRRPRGDQSPAFKAKVALEAIKSEEPVIVMVERFDVHPNKWPPHASLTGAREGQQHE